MNTIQTMLSIGGTAAVMIVAMVLVAGCSPARSSVPYKTRAARCFDVQTATIAWHADSPHARTQRLTIHFIGSDIIRIIDYPEIGHQSVLVERYDEPDTCETSDIDYKTPKGN